MSAVHLKPDVLNVLVISFIHEGYIRLDSIQCTYYWKCGITMKYSLKLSSWVDEEKKKEINYVSGKSKWQACVYINKLKHMISFQCTSLDLINWCNVLPLIEQLL